MTRLRSCDGCSRHVFVTEQVCPFCKRELTPAPAAPAAQVPSGLSRAQRLALAAALAGPGLAAAACTETTVVPVYGAPIAAGSTAGAGGTGVGGVAGVGTPVYGAPIAGNPAPTAGSKAPMPTAGGVPTPVYGVPLAGSPAPMDAGVTPEPDDDAGGVATPVYGAPIPQK